MNSTIIMNSTNVSTTNFALSDVDHIIWKTWLSVVFVFGIIGNLLLFSVILRKGRVTNVSNLFNLNLAVSDLTRIVLFIPVYQVYSEDGEWPSRLGIAGCKGIFMVFYSCMTVSILTLMFMSMERYRAVVHPLKKQMTIKPARYLVMISWVVGLVTSSWMGVSLNLFKFENGPTVCVHLMEKLWAKSLLLVVFIGAHWVPGTVFMVAYVKIILKLRRDGAITPSDVSQSSQNRHRRNKRAARILVIEVVMFMVCLYPAYQNFFVETFGHSDTVDPLALENIITFCMMMTYCLTNPLAHLVLNSEFRAEIAQLGNQVKVLCRFDKRRINACPHYRLRGTHSHHRGTRRVEEKTIGEVETTL